MSEAADAIQIAVTAILLSCMHIILRASPIWQIRHRGCDAFYFLQAAEAFRTRRRLPIVLPPYYILEPQQQAYPPMMAMLLGTVPEAWVRQYHWLFNAIIEIVSLVMLTIWLGSQYGIAWACVAGIAYSANASLTNEFSALTSRSLALALTNIFLISAFFGAQGSEIGLAIGVVCAVVILYTHKLSVQLLWFLTPFLALVLWEPLWLIYIPVAYAIALAIAPRVFVDILRGHWDIVTFWGRNWALLGAHPVRQSPIYGSGASTGSGYYRRHDLSWLLSRLGKILDYNSFVCFVPLSVVFWSDLSTLERFALVVVIGTYAWGVATYLLKPLRSLGEGNKYFKYALIPSLVLTAAVVSKTGGLWPWAVAAFCVLWTVWAYVRTWQAMRHKTTGVTGQLTPELSIIFDKVIATEGARILCLPLHLSDLAAYRTRKPVLWGTHGLGFRDAEPLFPVMRKPIEHFVSTYGLTHLIVDESYVTLAELKLQQGREVMREGSYLLWDFAA